MLKIDLHIHTIHSGHAYGTFYDVAHEAARKKMEMIAITDHGPEMVGVSGFIHFRMGRRVPKVIDGVRILWGCEANIMDGDGSLDLKPYIQKEVDVLIVGLHTGCPYKDLGKKKNTEAIIKALQNPLVDMMSHPTHPQFEYDMEQVFQAAIDNNVLLELNLAYIGDNYKFGKEGVDHMDSFKKMIAMVKKSGKKLIVNSDAHFLHEIGDDSILKKHWDELGLTKEIIINNYPDELKKFLNIE